MAEACADRGDPRGSCVISTGDEAMLPAWPAGLSMQDDADPAIFGGNPVRRTPWPTYDKGAVCVHAEDEEAGVRAIRSQRYFRYDRRPYSETECGRLEECLCRYFGCAHALVTSSGTTALALALMAAGIARGSAVAWPAFSFAATPSAIRLAGCEPFLVEVDQDLHLDLADLRWRWTAEI